MRFQGFCGFLSRSLLALAILSAPVYSTSVQAQSAEKGEDCSDDITADAGYKFRSVKVKARYLPALRHPLPAKGAPYSPETVTTIVEDVSDVLTKEKLRESEEGQTEHSLLGALTVGKGQMSDAFGFGIKFVTACTKKVAPTECSSALGEGNSQCVDVTVHAFSVRVDAGNPIANMINIPRSNRPSFLSKVPGPLLAFNPHPNIQHDRSLGPSAGVDVETNLLDLTRNLQSQPLPARKTRLDLKSGGHHSLGDTFYETISRLSLSRSFAGLVEQAALDMEYEANHQPEGPGEYLRNVVRLGGGLKFRTGLALFDAVTIKGRYRWSSNRLNTKSVLAPEAASESSIEGNALLDGRLWKGASRLGLWVDANSPNAVANNYQRAAALWGYQREFIVVPNQTIGVEVLVGGGKTWGNPPRYARFYGGNLTKNFLYEAKDSPVLANLPRGPLLRSFGSGRATAGTSAAGATAYWNVNLNVTVPVPAWSVPLVPDIKISVPKKDAAGRVVVDENQDPVMEDKPLSVILKNQGESSRKVLQRIFIKQGMSSEEAEAKARRELKSINSILGFIADEANIYSFKPLFMFDAARLNSPDAIVNRTKFAIGGGVQFTLVIAKFEAGYMRTLRPLPGDNKGNFVMRLFFGNLF